MRFLMFRRFAAAGAAASAVSLLSAASVAAATASYEDGVFRYRAQPGESVEPLYLSLRGGEAEGTAAHLQALTSQTVNQVRAVSPAPALTRSASRSFVRCAHPAKACAPRYRLSLSGRADTVDVTTVGLRGVVYSGRGEDTVRGAERVYGGIGNDSLAGTRVHGGPDDDFIDGRSTESGAPAVLRGGTGDDIVDAWPAPSLVYGWPGWDQLRDSRRRDMLVGGPGHDEIDLLYANDSSLDVVRVRGGGRDFVDCHRAADRQDVFVVDPADRVEDECRSGRIVLTGRPGYVR